MGSLKYRSGLPLGPFGTANLVLDAVGRGSVTYSVISGSLSCSEPKVFASSIDTYIYNTRSICGSHRIVYKKKYNKKTHNESQCEPKTISLPTCFKLMPLLLVNHDRIDIFRRTVPLI